MGKVAVMNTPALCLLTPKHGHRGRQVECRRSAKRRLWPYRIKGTRTPSIALVCSGYWEDRSLQQDHRRLAAILAADVVGYSKLMATDESGTLALLKRLRAEVIEPKIAQFHGRI